ncbi:hypothetical protein [Janthinobacterium fluminis]|uniref:Uncharacterized protein n=1 Tax=Janthinobacterium fluminis TaxID=2987524 RepID=A0ABT5JUJ1_9BURK|nr:hypothetical protein [Janthinobacterium fluminis]MDC8756239.1 hypothetical protein [Janthinobacterium fluminis]
MEHDYARLALAAHIRSEALTQMNVQGIGYKPGLPVHTSPEATYEQHVYDLMDEVIKPQASSTRI